MKNKLQYINMFVWYDMCLHEIIYIYMFAFFFHKFFYVPPKPFFKSWLIIWNNVLNLLSAYGMRALT